MSKMIYFACLLVYVDSVVVTHEQMAASLSSQEHDTAIAKKHHKNNIKAYILANNTCMHSKMLDS